MCGITDHIFRTLCYEMGCDLAYTEMISAMGYLCAPEQRATKELMIRGENEPKLVLSFSEGILTLSRKRQDGSARSVYTTGLT